MEFYTYLWRDAAGTPFYVGKGKEKRATETGGGKRSAEFLAVHSQGGCTVEIVDEFMIESQAHAHEMELIERYGRREFGGLLVNKTDGGEGASGAVRSPEYRARISAALMGHTHGEVAIAKIGAASLGRTHSAESRAKISAGLTGRVVSVETRQKLTGQTRTADARQRISAGIRMSGPRKGRQFKGVFANRDRWCATILLDGKPKHLGRFRTPEEAARAYDAAAFAAWGDGCYLNFKEAA